MLRTLVLLLCSPLLLAQKIPHPVDSYTIRSVILESDVSFSRHFLQHFILLSPGQTYRYPALRNRLLHLQALSALQWYLNLDYLPRYREDGSVDVYVLAHERSKALRLVGGASGLTGEGGNENAGVRFSWPQFIVPGGVLQFDIGLRQGVQFRLPYLAGTIVGVRFALANQFYPFTSLDNWQGPEESALFELLFNPYPSLDLALGARTLWLPRSSDAALVQLGDPEVSAFARVFWDHYFALATQALGWKIGAAGEYFFSQENMEVGFDSSVFWRALPWLGVEAQLAAVAGLNGPLRSSSWFRLNPWLVTTSKSSLIYHFTLQGAFQLVSTLPDSLASVGFGLLPTLALGQLLNWQEPQLEDFSPQILLFIGPYVDIFVGGGTVVRLALQPGMELQDQHFLLRFFATRQFTRPRTRWGNVP